MLRTFSLFASLAFTLVVTGQAWASDGMPPQAYMDNPPADSSMSGGSWADMNGGAAARPFIKSLTVVNGSQSTLVFSGGVTAAEDVAIGDVTGVVTPINLCKRDQPVVVGGTCYATPNRVGITIGYLTDQGVGTDFSQPLVALRQPVGPDTVFDVVIGLNTMGQTLRWTWINGVLVNWKTADLGQAAAEIHLRLKPAVTPDIDWSHVTGGCTATPIFDCNIGQASGAYLGASAVLSLDDTLDRSLDGAAFATQGAVSGYLIPSGTATDPALDFELASSHLTSDGSPQRGALQAFLPAQALISTYGILPADAASFFTTTRRGDPGTQDPPQFEAIASTALSDPGLLVTVRNVTFSAPTYRFARKHSSIRVLASTDRRATHLSTERVAACRRRACRLVVYRTRPDFSGSAVRVASARSDPTGTSAATVPTTSLPRGSSYIAVLRRGAKLLASSGGVVSRSRAGRP